MGENVESLKPGDRVAMEPGIYCGYCNACRDGTYYVGGTLDTSCLSLFPPLDVRVPGVCFNSPCGWYTQAVLQAPKRYGIQVTRQSDTGRWSHGKFNELYPHQYLCHFR